MNLQAIANLLTALHGQAFANAKYRLYAELVRQQGNDELADLFDTSAAPASASGGYAGGGAAAGGEGSTGGY
jgi:hypothetical protein